jgi:ADP-ribose pyrophosphatase
VIGDWLWEIPAGKLDPGETPLQTAQRELAEEAGVQAQRWRSLGAIVTTPGFCDEVIHLFLARNFTIVQPCHDAHEVIEVCWRTQSELESMIASGELRDAKTLVAIYRWLAHETA